MIDYLKIAHAVLIAKTSGFRYREVPWIADESTVEITTPEDARRFYVDKVRFAESEEGAYASESYGALVGSGEQSLLDVRHELKNDEKLVVATPCFRDEVTYEPGVTEPQFFKVELMVANPSDPVAALMNVLVTARLIMGTWNRFLREVGTEEGVDLYLGDLEVGSYGKRVFGDFEWVYGTGLALPRFDTALAKYNGINNRR